MTDLVPTTALGGKTTRVTRHGALTMIERPDLSLASLSLAKGSPDVAPLGLTLPPPGRWSSVSQLRAVWLAQNQWLIEAEGEIDLATQLIADQPGAFITDQTDGWAAMDVSADGRPETLHALLEKLVNIDPAALAPGGAARTGLEHMSVMILRLDEDRARIMGMRSFFGSLWHAVDTAAKRLR